MARADEQVKERLDSVLVASIRSITAAYHSPSVHVRVYGGPEGAVGGGRPANGVFHEQSRRASGPILHPDRS